MDWRKVQPGLAWSNPEIRFKMKTPKTPPKYTVEQISEIRNRIATLRARWLHSIEGRLAPQKSETHTNETCDTDDHNLEG